MIWLKGLAERRGGVVVIIYGQAPQDYCSPPLADNSKFYTVVFGVAMGRGFTATMVFAFDP